MRVFVQTTNRLEESMVRKLGIIVFAGLSFVTAMPAGPAKAQDPIGGAIVGGLLGAGVGAAIGRGPGAAIGAGVGAGVGAIAGSQAAPPPAYYGPPAPVYYEGGPGSVFWGNDGRCYYQYPNGSVRRIPRDNCR
jgi:hypothetical protein